MEKKKKKINTKKLFNNSKFIMMISFVLACIFWVAFASGTDEETSMLVTDIPVTIELPEQAKKDGLKVYRGGDITATVQVSGNRLTVGSISKSDIQIVAQNTSSITTANTYALSLSAKKSGVKTDYEIVSVSPSIINVTIDKERIQEFTVEDNIDISNVKLPVDTSKEIIDYYLSKPVMSNNTVTVIGPEQEVKEISKVQISDTITGEHKANINKKLRIQLLDSGGELIESDLLSVTPENVDITIQVLPEREINIIPTFVNVPDGINVTKIASVKPAKITIAAEEARLLGFDKIDLAPIDFNNLDPTTTQITENIVLPNGFINISNEEHAKVTLNLSDYSSTVVTIENILPDSVPSGYSAEVSTKTLNISVAGPKDIINEITPDDIKASVDLSGLASDFEGSQELPVTIDLSPLNKCWCFSEYTVNVSVKKNE